jgi:hypothetical protein
MEVISLSQLAPAFIGAAIAHIWRGRQRLTLFFLKILALRIA